MTSCSNESSELSSATTCTSSRRLEASGLGWQEHFVDTEQASLQKSVGAAISNSLSYVTIPDFGSLEERCVLTDSAWAQHDSSNVGGDAAPHVLGASQVNVLCTRYPVESLPETTVQVVHAAFMHRLLELLEQDVELWQVFGKSNLTTGGYSCKWYSEPDDTGTLVPEPKVNLYQTGGFFKEHTDGMQLTLLVVLNDTFDGGGTAFYAESNDTEEQGTQEEEPNRVARPPAGTAMIWGGDLRHMALPVTKGWRAVYVGSFDLVEEDE